MEYEFRGWNGKDFIYGGAPVKSLSGGYYYVKDGWDRCETYQGVIAIDQWTGLKDVNGVKIYDGDILGFGDDSPENKSGMYGELGFVFMCENHGQWMVKLFYSGREVQLADHLLFSDGHTCRRVYGNIHQNPELLE